MFLRVLSLLFLLLQLAEAENEFSPWALEVGVGNYETLHFAGVYDFHNSHQLYFSLGSNLGVSDDFTYSLSVGDRIFMLPKSEVLRNAFVNAKVLYWSLEDVSFIWHTFSTQVLLGYQHQFMETVKISFEAGYSLNVYETNKRKNFEQQGYPRTSNAVFNLSVLYYF